jgi:hypothetical protein
VAAERRREADESELRLGQYKAELNRRKNLKSQPTEPPPPDQQGHVPGVAAAAHESKGIYPMPPEIPAEICSHPAVEERVNLGEDGRMNDASTRQPLYDLCLAPRRLGDAARLALYRTISFYVPRENFIYTSTVKSEPESTKAAREHGQRSLVLFLRSLLENASLRSLVKQLDCLVSLRKTAYDSFPHPNGDKLQQF